ncbi:MAG: hypothetical protein R2684_06985 [Pyrinomonadaceae bacterium]
MKRIKIGSAMAIMIAVFAMIVEPALACGPFTIDPVFGFGKHGEYPLKDYVDGKVGMVPNSYGRISLFVFYRYLTDNPVPKKDQSETARALRDRIGGGYSPGDVNEGELTPKEDSGAETEWLSERKKVLEGDAKVGTDRSLKEDYGYYTNCLQDSFRNATKTLRMRESENRKPEDIKSWLRAQDAVFSNCEENGTLPEDVGAGAPEWLRFDRQYQIASAHFYREDYEAARKEFERISAEKQSPWADVSEYLVARTYIRQASLLGGGEGESANRAEENRLLESAAAALKKIASESSNSNYSEPAKRLLGLVRYRQDPDGRAVELSKMLTSEKPNPNIYNDLTDYIWLLDKLEWKASNVAYASNYEGDIEPRLFLKYYPEKIFDGGLTDWLLTYQSIDGYEHALKNWESTKSIEWLLAAISKAKKDAPEVEKLIAAAKSVKKSSPAYLTANFHAVRLLEQSRKIAEARELSTKLLSGLPENTTIAAKNRLFEQRLDFDETIDEFLEHAQLTPTAFLWSDDFTETGSSLKQEGELQAWESRKMFGTHASRHFNSGLPLSIWLAAAQSKELPDYLKDFLARAGWMRAFVLRDSAMERSFATLVNKHSPAFREYFEPYMNSRSPIAKEAAALRFIARYPVLEPYVESHWGRMSSDPKSIDSNRGNWWCNEYAVLGDADRPAFVTESLYKIGLREHSKLKALGEGASVFSGRVLEFANRNPRSPDTPELLHLAVRATRYGCHDANTGKNSKAAFDLLHRRYPKSRWTAETPYWYGGK